LNNKKPSHHLECNDIEEEVNFDERRFGRSDGDGCIIVTSCVGRVSLPNWVGSTDGISD
jgi:hypothetical protein